MSLERLSITIFVLTFVCAVAPVLSSKPPNIMLILADDMGFNDVGFRGSRDIPTPNIDALAYAGRILDRHYVLPTCTPSRSSLLTGRYAVRTGMQGYPLESGERRALPVHFKLLPEYLKDLGYSTHLLGKWHQGFYHYNQTPTYRGFDTFLGYYNGLIGYFDHEVIMGGPGQNLPLGFDMHRNDGLAWDSRNTYATELFTSEAEKIIREHDKEKPLFVLYSHLAVHSGLNGTEVEVEDEKKNDEKFSYIKDTKRRQLAGATESMDNSVGRVVRALADKGMLQDTIILFMADNGGATMSIHSNAASNYPLRGEKFAQFEGGVRGAAAIWHAGLDGTSNLHTDLMHITDWLPTLYEAAGGNVSNLDDDMDGVSQWGRLSGRSLDPPRTELLVNSEFLTEEDGSFGAQGRSYIDGWWKVVWNVIYPEQSQFKGESGNLVDAPPYDLNEVFHSAEHLFAASKHNIAEGFATRAVHLRNSATLPKNCRQYAQAKVPTCAEGCLYNLQTDPCETRDVSSEHPDVLARIKEKLISWEAKTVPQLNSFVDPKSDPRRFGGGWVPWEDVPPFA